MSESPQAGNSAFDDLAASAHEQARAVLSLVQGFAGADPGPGGDCQWCPVCRAARALRDGRPEVADHLSQAVTAALSAFASLNAALNAAAEPKSSSTEPKAAPSPSAPPAPRPRAAAKRDSTKSESAGDKSA